MTIKNTINSLAMAGILALSYAPVCSMELNLSMKGLETLPTEIANMPNLTKLDLFGNHIRTFHSSDISYLTNLTELRWSVNLLEVLPPFIHDLTNLTNLCVSDNKLAEIPDSIWELTNLKVLDFQN